MNLAELNRLLVDVESDRVERTISVSDTDKFSEAICAFANDMPNNGKPGYLFVGATPEGLASGVLIDDQLLQNLGAIRSAGNIQPLPTMNVEKWPLGGGEMAVVEVFPSDMPPVRYRGRTCIRVGPRRAFATIEEERRLTERRIHRALTWDARSCPNATLGDLALDLFTLSYRSNAMVPGDEEDDRPIAQQLASLRFFDPQFQHPTNAGILTFGKDPRSFFDHAYVQYVRYEGESPADDIREERRIGGDLFMILRDLKRLANELAEGRPRPEPIRADRMIFDYPPKAMVELLMNAVIHRDYEGSTTPIMVSHFTDRIEIQNPGGLFGDLKPEQLSRGTAYRNPVLAEAAKVLGYVNRFGRGIHIIRRELQQNDSPDAVFDPQPNFFLATVWRRP